MRVSVCEGVCVCVWVSEGVYVCDGVTVYVCGVTGRGCHCVCDGATVYVCVVTGRAMLWLPLLSALISSEGLIVFFSE